MENLSMYQFDVSPLWDDILARLNNSIESEINEALSQSLTSEIRSHQCGRAEALADFRNTLEHLRDKVKNTP